MAHCAIPVFADSRCQWHRHWLRLVDRGSLGQSQSDAFAEWWEQFQPYGCYADHPGAWWADMHVLWACLTGLGEMPVLTAVLSRELYLRRAEVRHFKLGLPWKEPWPRVSGYPLPPWEPARWQATVNAQCLHALKQRVLPQHETMRISETAESD